jgi:hypothetical protein
LYPKTFVGRVGGAHPPYRDQDASKNVRILENCGLDTPSRNIRGYSTIGVNLYFESVRSLLIFHRSKLRFSKC